MPKAIQLHAYGGVDVLEFADLPKPEPKAGEVLVRVVASSINPGEMMIREGALKEMFPMDFPFGEGTDLAGYVEMPGPGVTAFEAGDEVLGHVDTRSAHAEYAVVEEQNLTKKPPSLDFYRAGSLFVAGSTAIAAVRAVGLKPGDTVAISGAAGGVGSLAVQLAVRGKARVIGVAGAENEAFLASIGAEHVAYGEDLERRLKELVPNGIDAWIDFFGKGYVELAVKLGIAKERIDTIIDFEGAQKFGVKSDGSAAAADVATLRDLADLVAYGEIVMPIAAIYPFASIRDAYVELAKRKTRGKIVLAMDSAIAAPLRAPSKR